MDNQTYITPEQRIASENLQPILEALNGKGLLCTEAEYELARALTAVLRERRV